ncbi:MULTISPECIES: helix-turn-helix domain-containing protein [unclassified Moraxella]|uniref:helix-turn-helix domain-containing protein n=1 Tax=unclassified Moraxella TaxID=2685852 RepID=UPI003AF637D0
MKTIHSERYGLLIDELIASRKRQGLTQQQVAEWLEKPQSYIAKIEGRERKMDVMEFMQLCEVLGLTPSLVIAKFESPSAMVKEV